LFIAGLTGCADAAAVDHTANADPVADLELRHVRTDRRDQTRDLMARDQRIVAVPQVVVHDVQVGMADACELDIDDHIVRPRIPSREAVGCEGRGGRGRGEGACGDGHGDVLGKRWVGMA
jgi:glutaredoxin